MYDQLTHFINEPKALVILAILVLEAVLSYIFKVAFEDWYKKLENIQKFLVLIAISVFQLGLAVVLIILYLLVHPG